MTPEEKRERQRIANRKWREANKEKANIATAKWRENNKESVKAYEESHREDSKKRAKAWREANKEKCREQSRQWRKENIDRVKELNKAQYQKNPLVFLRATREWRKAHPEQVKTQRTEWLSANRESYLANAKAHSILRKKVIAAQKIAKSHMRQTSEIYKNCPDGHHVDHIVPLKGKLVSGLHVPWNLQYLPALENLKKGNKHEVD
jgi:hypothetical protein